MHHETVSVAAAALPQTAVLESVYPNSFNPSAAIQFTLTEETVIDLSVFNLKGERIKSPATGRFAAGTHQVVWDGTNDTGVQQSTGTPISFASQPPTDLKREVVLGK